MTVAAMDDTVSRAGCFSFEFFRIHLDPRAPLSMPAYNKGNVIRGGFGGAFRGRDQRPCS